MSGHFEFPSMHEGMGSVGTSETIHLGNVSTTCACTGRCKMPPYTCGGQPSVVGHVVIPTVFGPADLEREFKLRVDEMWRAPDTNWRHFQPTDLPFPYPTTLTTESIKPRIRVKAGSRKLPA